MEPTTATIERVIEMVEHLQPKEACKLRGGNMDALCATPVIESIIIKNRMYKLSADAKGKILAGYVRVSTERQKQDGLSVADQVYRIALHCAENGFSFRIFSDAELSGSLPINDEQLMKEVWELKADLYQDNFTKVFINHTENKYSFTERAQMRAFVKDAAKRIKHGQTNDLANSADYLQDSLNLSGDMEIDETPLCHKAVSKIIRYRPALTILCEDLNVYHTIAFTDLSRLSRSQLTFAQLHKRFDKVEVHVEGLMESLTWISDRENSREIGPELMAFLLPKLAEKKVADSMRGSFIGIAVAFEMGRPHGKIGQWFKRNKEGLAELDENQEGTSQNLCEAVRAIIRLYRNETMGFDSIEAYLAAQGFRTKRGKAWDRGTIADILQNVALCGYQVMFGRRWKVFPELMSEDEF